jgi:hypothetical protein
MVALDVDQARTLGIIGVVALVVLAFVAASVVRNVTVKLVMIGVLLAVAVVVYTQRGGLEDCADRVRDAAADGVDADTTCRLLWVEVTVPDVELPDT